MCERCWRTSGDELACLEIAATHNFDMAGEQAIALITMVKLFFVFFNQKSNHDINDVGKES